MADKDFKVKKGLQVTENIELTGNLKGPAVFNIEPKTVGTDSGTVRILGKLQVEGTTTVLNSTTVTINDKNIVLADSATNAAAADGAGLTINGANATLTYAQASDRFVFNKNVQAGTFVGNLTGNVTGNITGTVSDLSNHTLYTDSDFDASFALASTDSLSEGSTNLYHTTARARSSISGDKGISYNSSTGVIDVDSTNITSIARGSVSASGALTYNSATGQFSFVSGQSGLIDSSLAQGMIDSNFNNIDSLNVTGTITAGTINASNITGDGSGITGAGLDSALIQQLVDSNLTSGRNIAGTLTTAAQPNITSLGTLTSIATSGNISMGDNDELRIGDGNDIKIFHNSTESRIENHTGILRLSGTDIRVNSIDQSKTSAFFETAAGVTLQYNGSQKFETTNTGVNITGNIVVSGTVDGRDVATDGTKLDGIATGATANAITNPGADRILTSTGGGNANAEADFQFDGTNVFIPNEIRHIGDPDTKLGFGTDTVTVTAGGVAVQTITSTGTAHLGNLAFTDNYEARFGTGLDLTIAHFGGNSEIRNRTGEFKILGDNIKIRNDANSELYISAVNNGAVELYHNNVKKIETTSGGATVTGTVTATSFAGDGSNLTGLNIVADTSPQLGGDLASNGNNINIADGDLLQIGTGNDLQIYHQSNVTYLKSTNTAAPIRLQAPAGEIMGNFAPNAGVELYYDGTKKIETTSAGATVTGALTVSGDLTINGTTTTINSTTLDVDDLNITVAKGAADAAAANGAGLTVDGASATLLYQSTGDKFVFNKALEATSFTGNVTSTSVNIDGGAIDGTNIGANTPGTGAFTTVDINGGTVDGASIGATTPGTGAFTTLTGNTVGGFSHLSAVGGGGTVDVVVTVASKTAAHRYNGTGSGLGFVLDGVQAPYLTLTPGRTYKFKQDDNSNSGHPFRFYYDAAKTTAYTTNVTTNLSAGQSGSYTQIVVDENPPAVLHYQCSAHGYMGNAARFGTRNFTGFTTDNVTEGSTNLYYTTARQNTDFDTRFGTKSTANLTENTNLYYTNARADARIAAANLSDLNNVTGVPSSGQFLKWNGSNWVPDTVSSGGGTVDSASTITLINSTVDSSYLASRVTASATFTPKPKYARLGLTSSQVVASGASTALTNFNTRVTDTSNSNALTSTLADGKFIIPAGVSKVKLRGSVRMQTPTDQVSLSIWKNGAKLEGTTNFDIQSTGGDYPAAFSVIEEVAQNDYFQLYIYNQTGTPTATADVIFSWFELEVVEGSILTDFGNINLADLGNVATTAPSSGQVLKWNGSAWAPAADATGGGGGGSQNLFSTIAVAGQSDVVADATTDTLTLVAGSNMTITTNAGSDTITFASTGGGGGGSGGLDSALTTQLIDSAYVNARQSGGEITVKDEGSALSTAASTLNFVGAGVVASGSGAEKTITIAGGSTGVDSAATINLIDSDYVQARMLGINSSKITEFKYIADSGDTVFQGNDANGNALAISATNHEVYLNGIRLLNGDFTTDASANRITLAQSVDSADEVVIVTQGSLTTNDRFVVGAGTQRFFFSADSGQTAFTGNDKHGNALTFDSGQVDVYLNGILLTNEDVIQNGTTNTITLTAAADSADDLAVIAYNATLASTFTAGTGTLNTFKYTLNAAQTAISGADVKGNTLAYIPGNQQVFLNGLLLEDSDDYTTTSTSVLTLTSGANAGDEIIIQDYASKFSGNTAGIINPEFKEFKFIADSGDTVFSGNDANGQALSLTSANQEVFLNGIRLLASDYVANTSTNTITLQGFTAADSDEIVISTIVGNVRFNAASSVASIVDSAYVAARSAAGTDSASVISLINATVNEAYITRHSLDSSLALQLLLDSSEIIDLIDSAYVNARVSTVDSAQVLGIVDSDYVDLVTGIGQRDVDFGTNKILYSNNYANLAALPSASTYHGMFAHVHGQGKAYYAHAGNWVQLADKLETLDSFYTTALIDSAYIQARQDGGTATNTFSTFRYVATEGQSVYTGNDASSNALTYDSANLQVFLNGLLLTKTEDFTLQNKNQITLQDSVNAGSELIINNYSTKFVAENLPSVFNDSAAVTSMIDSAYVQIRATGGGVTYNAASSNITLVKGNAYIVDTSSARTLTLPASGTLGDEIKVIDGTGQAGTNNITINRNGHKIQGLTDNLVINVNRAAQGLVYYNAAQGWILSEN